MSRQRPSVNSAHRLAIALGASLLIAALGFHPRATNADRSLARTALAAAAGQPAAALQSLDEALGFDPALASLHLAAARLAMQAGDPAAMRHHLDSTPEDLRRTDEFECLLASLPSGAEGEVRPAPTACNEPFRAEGVPAGIPGIADLREMVAALEAELDQAPEDLPAWERLAALTELTDSPEVETVILRAYRSFPQGSRILDGLWDISHQDDPALSAAERAARTGQLLAASGDWRLAGAAWSRAVALEPVFPQAQAYLGLATSRTGGDGLPLLLEAMQQAPEDPVVRSLLGQYWLGAGSPADAVRELSHAHRLDPASPAISAALGAAFAQAGRLEEASEAYRQAAVHDPQDPDFWLLLAEFSLRYDFEVESIGREAARNAVALSPQDSNARSALGTANVIAGDLVAGEQLLHEAITLDPANALAWYRFALFLLDEGRVDEARRALSTAAALEPSGVVAQLSTASLANLETGYR